MKIKQMNENFGGKEPKDRRKLLKRVGNITAFLNDAKTQIQIQNKAGKTLINIDIDDMKDFNTVMKALNNEIK